MRVLGRLRKTRRWRVVTAGLVVVAVGAGTGAWLLVGEDTPAAAETTTATVSSTTVRDTVAVTGTIAPANETTLDFAVSGTVTEVLVEPGDTVRRGDPLVRVDTTALVATRAAALASLDAAEAQLDEDEDAGASDLQVTADRVLDPGRAEQGQRGARPRCRAPPCAPRSAAPSPPSGSRR